MVEHVSHGPAFRSMALDERVVTVFECDEDAGEAVRRGLRVLGGVLLLVLRGECSVSGTGGTQERFLEHLH